MVSFFGEVVFPKSRAFWEEEEDENEAINQEINEPQFNIQWLKEKPIRINTLVIIEGKTLIDFSRECLCQNADEVCVIDDRQKKICIIYQINKDVYSCMISPHFDVKYSGKLVNKITDIIQSSDKTISITCCHISLFKSKNIPMLASFLRMLISKNGENVCPLKETLLEQPNIVYGVTAGVLSYAEFMDLPSALYILYMDSFVMDSLTAEPLLKLFTAMNCTPHDVTFTGKNFFNKGNLYM